MAFPQKRHTGSAAKRPFQILGPLAQTPLRAIAEDIPLDIIYEDDDLVVINKPAGMMVHAGAGATDDARNRGTLVNALLHRFASLSQLGESFDRASCIALIAKPAA